MKKSKELLIKKISVLLIIVFMIMTSFLSTNTISADDPGIKTFGELKTAIENAEGEATIEIENDIAMEETITIDSNKKITIQGKGNETYTLFQKQRDEGEKYQTMFAVIGTGDLTLGENLVLSGKIGTCPEGQKQDIDTFEHTRMVPGSYDLVGPKDGTKDNDYTMNKFPSGTETVGGTTTGAFSGGGYSLGLNTSQGEFSYNVDEHATTPLPFELEEKDGKIYLKADVHGPKYLSVEGGPNFRIKDNIDNAVHIKDTSGNDVTSLSDLDGSKNYLLYAAWCSRYISSSDNDLYWSTSLSEAVNFGVSVDTEGGEEKNYVEIPSAKNDVGELTNYVKYYLPEQQTEANSALDKLNKVIDPIKYKYWTLPDGTGEFLDPNSDEAKKAINQYNQDHKVEQTYWVLPNGVEYTDKTLAEQALEQYYEDNPPSVACKIEDVAACPAEGYTNKMFVSGDVGSPKGFFIHIEKSGKATLNGATLERFYTSRDKDSTVKHVAPVVVTGEKSSFDIVSGNISDNVVGYVVEDGKSDSTANTIKQYIKGAAPNAPRNGNISDRRRKPAGIDNGTPGSGITGTAGAVIYIDGASGYIYDDANISYNRGDTGGIMVSGSGTSVVMQGGNIDHNVGVQFGGGSLVENGGKLTMEGGTMKENVAWFGGGAVYATENGIAWLLSEESKIDYNSREDGKFILNGGTLDGNTAFTRGGAILADSDGVTLIKGKLINNKARMLGGAVYVMGDDPRYTYTVYIKQGYVHDNKAVSGTVNPGTAATSLTENKKDNMSLSKKLVEPCGCGEDRTSDYKLFGDDMDSNSDDCVDGTDNDGTGGGIWLCAYGSSNINLAGDEFVINNNYASGTSSKNYNGLDIDQDIPDVPDGATKTSGNDIHKDTKANGRVEFSGLKSSDDHQPAEHWYNENTGQKLIDEVGYDSGKDVYFSYGLRNLINVGKALPDGYNPQNLDDYEGVDIYGNISRRGGGLAADGTYIFGEMQDLANIYAEMKIDKIWNENLTPEDIAVKVYVKPKNGDKKYEIALIPLKEKAQEASELDTVFVDGIVDGKYTSHFAVPIFVEDDNGQKIPVFNVDLGGEILDLSSNADLKRLAEAVESGAKPALDTTNVEFVFEEGTLIDGVFTPVEYNAIVGGVSVDTEKTYAEAKKISEGTANEITIYNTNLYMKNSIINDHKRTVEKFVNQAVHSSIDLNEVFTYDVIAYASMDADKLTITDTLVDDLEFVSTGNEVEVVVLDGKNNHKVTYDVSGNKVNNDATVAESGKTVNASKQIEGSTLTVTIEGDNAKAIRGKWIKVTFQAQIKKEYQDKIANGEKSIKDLEHIKITTNSPVNSNEEHTGITNKASLKIEVENSGEYIEETNTVTVNPEKPEIEKYVNKAVHKFIDVNEVFEYDIIAYITSDAENVVITDTLVPDLEFVKESEVLVADMGISNNHKVENNIYSVLVNEDATVSKDGQPITNKQVSINGNELTVSFDGTNYRGHWVKVTFKAQISEQKQNMINNGASIETTLNFEEIDHTTVEDRAKPNVGNDPVISDEDHTGVPNNASYQIFIGNDPKYKDESNTVTVRPEKPEIEKYVNKDVHKDISLPEVFTYDILAYITNDADKFTITDTLVSDLEFVGGVKVYDLGTSNDHQPNGSVAKEGTDITEKADTASTTGRNLVVTFDDDVSIDTTTGIISRQKHIVENLRGHWVKVTFQAQIKEDLQKEILAGKPINKVLSFESIKANEIYKVPDSIYPEGEDRPEPNVGNAPVESKEDHQGVINTASYVIEVLNEAKYQDESNTVTVKPEQPEVEKYVNQAVHKDIELDEVFTYDIIGLVSKTADKVTFIDQLVDDLEIVDEDDIEVVYLDDNNHKPYNDISGNVVNTDASVAQKGTSIKDEKGVTVEVKDNCLTVTLDDEVYESIDTHEKNRKYHTVEELRGKYVKVTFKAQIKKELQDKIKAGEMKITDLKNVTVKGDENGLVLSNEKHNGIDNRAMMITVGNGSEIVQETNVVTVGPEVVTVVVKKIWDDGNNADKIRPDTVTIILLADGKEVERVNIAYNDNWTYTFANLVKSKDGKKIVYTVDEVSVKGYKKTINGYEITNTHIPDKPKKDYDIPKTGVK